MYRDIISEYERTICTCIQNQCIHDMLIYRGTMCICIQNQGKHDMLIYREDIYKAIVKKQWFIPRFIVNLVSISCFRELLCIC